MQNPYQSRIETLIMQLESRDIDLAIITSPKNVFYYTGFNSEPYERFMALVMDMNSQKQYLFVPSLDLEVAEKNSNIKHIVPVSDELNPYQIVKDTVGERVKIFGLETKSVSLYQQEQLNQFFPDFIYQDIGGMISKQRMRKTLEERKKVINAIQVIEKVLEEGIKKVKAGMTELDLVAEFEYLMRKFGAEGPSFSTTVLAGEKSSLPHGIPGRKTINKGEFLLIDMGVIVDGYCSDITRTFVIGEETVKQREIYEIVRKATEAGIHAAKSGVRIGEIDIAARNVIKQAGFGQYFNNRVGHGLGIDVHEEPSIHENNNILAESGLLFTVEPGIYIPGFGGVRIEENVYISKNENAEVLTTFPTDLIRIR
jgi:Xaa-Pro dipeptidase